MNLKGKWFEPVKCLQFCMCISHSLMKRCAITICKLSRKHSALCQKFPFIMTDKKSGCIYQPMGSSLYEEYLKFSAQVAKLNGASFMPPAYELGAEFSAGNITA